MVTPGGEIAFVSRMIEESKILRTRCQWFTSMLGMYSSVEVLIGIIRAAGVVNWAVKDLVQGHKTRRWCIAWSWDDMRPDLKTARGGTATLPKHLLPYPSEYDFNVPSNCTNCTDRLQTILLALELRWKFRPSIATGVGFTKENVWSRAARRKHQQQKKEEEEGEERKPPQDAEAPSSSEDDDDDDDDDTKPALGFKIRLTARVDTTDVTIRWLQGRDSVLFESFCGMLKRQLS